MSRRSMLSRSRLRGWYAGIVAFATVTCLSLATAFAGTTGVISGTAADTAGGRLAGVRITVTSPSQVATATTDASGRFTFVSLAPDTYVVSAERAGYDAYSLPGVTVNADAQQTLTLVLRKAERIIGRVQARSSADLVRPGTTADVYSIGVAQQDRASGLGGGGNLNSGYSAIATVPGAYVPANQSGYNQAIHIRGGDSDQIGFEFDGVPVNRGFDGYPAGALSSLGQQELQVYTGASPANSESQGLAGSVNQVVKTGTYPGFANVDVGIGGPTFYHSLNAEAGGANAKRTFSYYVGVGGYNQDHRYIDQYNGRSFVDRYGPVIAACPSSATIATLPSCFYDGNPATGVSGAPGYILGPISFGSLAPANVAVRTTVANVHVGIPHPSGLKDDVQLLYDNDQLFTQLFSSPTDLGLNVTRAITGGAITFPYADSWRYTGAVGTFLPGNAAALVTPYYFPSSPRNRTFGSPVPIGDRDRDYNAQSIVKLQYQKNFSAGAYLRLYGYSFYSDYLDTGEQLSYQTYAANDSGDYEVTSHTRGVSGIFAAQLDSRNLLQLQAGYTTSRSQRVYNTQPFGSGDAFAVLVDPRHPASGTCYAAPAGASGEATPVTCANATYASPCRPRDGWRKSDCERIHVRRRGLPLLRRRERRVRLAQPRYADDRRLFANRRVSADVEAVLQFRLASRSLRLPGERHDRFARASLLVQRVQ